MRRLRLLPLILVLLPAGAFAAFEDLGAGARALALCSVVQSA
jgi:hypothetical protein